MPGYYDLVLGAIPSTLFGVSGMLHLSGVEFTTAVPLAGLLAVVIMGHAMFIRAPGSSGHAAEPGRPGTTEPTGARPEAATAIQAAD